MAASAALTFAACALAAAGASIACVALALRALGCTLVAELREEERELLAASRASLRRVLELEAAQATMREEALHDACVRVIRQEDTSSPLSSEACVCAGYTHGCGKRDCVQPHKPPIDEAVERERFAHWSASEALSSRVGKRRASIMVSATACPTQPDQIRQPQSE